LSAFAQLSAALTEALDELVRRVSVSLAVVSSGQAGAGAGIVWDRGLILTNAHVVTHRTAQVRLHDGREFAARLVQREPQVDLALLAIDAGDLVALPLADGTPRVGEMVFAFGHPWGQRDSVTGGVISALGSIRTPGQGGSLRVIRSDVPLAPGNSGGPLVNGAGELMGVNAMIVGGDQSLSIPAEVAREFCDRALAGRPVGEAAR